MRIASLRQRGLLFCAWVAAGALVAGLSPVRAAMPGQSEKARSATAWGPPVHGIQAGIELVTRSANAKSPQTVQVRFLLRNTTDHPANFAYGNAQRIYGWEVTRQPDGVWLVAPRWRHWPEEKLEPLIAGAMECHIPAMGQMPLPLEGPRLVIAQGAAPDRLTIRAKRGERVRIQGAPITAAARGEEWLDKLKTGVLTIESGIRSEPHLR